MSQISNEPPFSRVFSAFIRGIFSKNNEQNEDNQLLELKMQRWHFMFLEIKKEKRKSNREYIVFYERRRDGSVVTLNLWTFAKSDAILQLFAEILLYRDIYMYILAYICYKMKDMTRNFVSSCKKHV